MARKKRQAAAAPVIEHDEETIAEDEEEVALPPPSKGAGLMAFGKIAERFKGFRPAREVLRRVSAVPTIFPPVDHGPRVGGWPIDRVCVVHGPSNNGKTTLCHGLGLSFLMKNHIYALIDAEMTTPITWLESMFGPYADSGAFVAMRPKSYEQAVDEVRRLANTVAEERDKGKLPPGTSALFAVDSVRKLVPEDIMTRIKKMGAEGEKGSIDGYGGRAAQLRAALNAAWMDELVPLMHATRCAIIFIARESEDPNADARDKMFGNDWKMGGGKSLEFESSLIARVQRDGYVHETAGDFKSRVVGERHRVDIRKTKVAAKQDKVTRCFFHTSNGAIVPEGFDRARDLVEAAERVGVIERLGEKGSWLKWQRKKWQGVNRAVAAIAADPEMFAAIDAEARAQFDNVNPPEAGEADQ